MKIATILAAALLASAAQAKAYTGNEILSQMEGGPASNLQAMHYIDGLVDGDMIAAITRDEQPSICMPAGSTLGQARDTVKAYLVNNPATRHRMAGVLVFTVLRSAYPCPTKQRQSGKGQSL